MSENNVRIGARILSKDALDNLLPANKNIYVQIENIRKVALEYNANKVNRGLDLNKCILNDREFGRSFNNVFSILGGRGSGKTSALLTVKYKLAESNSKNIVLPLIVPENMGKTSDVLGWTFGQLEKIIVGLEKEINNGGKIESTYIKDNFFDGCRKKENSPLREKFYELLKCYKYIHEEYREILIKNYDGFRDYVKDSQNMLVPEDNLLTKFEDLIQEIFKVKKEKPGNTEEQLLFIFFDDVDLSSERGVEVLDVILRYLSNPNIVVFVSGDYDTFAEMITIKKLDTVNLLDSELMEKDFYKDSAIEIRKDLAQDILKKSYAASNEI